MLEAHLAALPGALYFASVSVGSWIAIRNCGLSGYVRTEIGREHRGGLASCSMTRLCNIVWFSGSSQVIFLFL